ncbi:MAG: holin [Hespellia sp.]|nr:holin [Hespellia sp.]
MFNNTVFKVSVDTKKWLKASGVRAIKTMAQTAVAVIGTSAVVSSVNWQMVVSSAVVAGIVSVLTSVAGIPEVTNNDLESEE